MKKRGCRCGHPRFVFKAYLLAGSEAAACLAFWFFLAFLCFFIVLAAGVLAVAGFEVADLAASAWALAGVEAFAAGFVAFLAVFLVAGVDAALLAAVAFSACAFWAGAEAAGLTAFLSCFLTVFFTAGLLATLLALVAEVTGLAVVLEASAAKPAAAVVAKAAAINRVCSFFMVVLLKFFWGSAFVLPAPLLWHCGLKFSASALLLSVTLCSTVNRMICRAFAPIFARRRALLDSEYEALSHCSRTQNAGLDYRRLRGIRQTHAA